MRTIAPGGTRGRLRTGAGRRDVAGFLGEGRTLLAEHGGAGLALASTVTRMRQLVPFVSLGLAPAALAGWLAACGHDTPPPIARPVLQTRPLPPADAAAPPPKLPEWTYWEPVEAPVGGSARAPDVPLTDAQIARVGGAETRWNAAPLALRDLVKKGGFGVVASGTNARVGALYAKLRDEKIPFVVTLDALFFLSHLAIERALAEVESTVILPALDVVIKRLDTRLLAESRDARADLAPAYTVARGVVAVAAALAHKEYVPAPDIAEVVAKEKARVLSHAGPGESPLLGVTVDYSAMALRGIAEKDEARGAWFRANAWLAHAPFMLAGRGEDGSAGRVSVTLARTHARAALMISRLLDRAVDADAAKAWELVERLGRFIAGPADDVTPFDLARSAASAGIDMKDARFIANVVQVDKLRHAATREHVTRLFDGPGGVRMAARDAGAGRAGTGGAARMAPSLRVFGARTAPDGEVMQALVFPAIGAMTPTEHPPPTSRDAVRALPSALDVASWLGATEARAALHDAGDDGYEGYDAALERLARQRATDDTLARHGSLYTSSLDAIATYVAPSAADAGQPGAVAQAWRQRKMETALSAWTFVRHDAITFTRLPLAASGTADPPRTASASTPAFVELHPEAIATLVGTVRQALRGLTAMEALASDSPARAMLKEVDDLLTIALGIALRQANDEPLAPQEAAALASFPARMVDLESRIALTGSADTPVVADVHADLAPARVLEEATGYVDEIYIVVAEPRTRRLVLAVGASIPHFELVQPASLRLSDIGWRARLQAGSAPQRGPWTKSFLVDKNATLPGASSSAATSPSAAPSARPAPR